MSSQPDPFDSTSINLTSEDLEEVPLDDIVKYPQVLFVDLSINSIRALSIDFAPRLSNIIHLDLSKNCLEKLPPNFGQLNNLEHLDLYSNRIQCLPVSMDKMTKLVWLDMKDNPINSCLKEVVGDFWNADECRSAARNIVFFMSQVRMFIDNVTEFEYQNVHSFTLKTNPFSKLINPTFDEEVKESFATKHDNDYPEQKFMDHRTWSLKRSVISVTVMAPVITIAFAVILYGPRTMESFFAWFGCQNPIDNFIVKTHKYVQGFLAPVIPGFPLVKDIIIAEEVPKSWYQKLRIFSN